MAFKRRGRRGMTRPKRETVWCSTLLTQILVVDTTQEFVLVSPDEWERNDLSMQKGATLQTIRGWLSMLPGLPSTGAGALLMVIWVADTDDAPFNPSVIATYSEEDILWTGGMGSSQNTGGTEPATWNGPRHMEIEINAKRKLTSAREVRLSMISSSSANDWRLSGLLRGLVALP